MNNLIVMAKKRSMLQRTETDKRFGAVNSYPLPPWEDFLEVS
ncbi:MAG TPA: hypothetical protein VFC96_05230 [Anaerovoracaceae bacterium]|nr:hypothetical protein [Anaerovoracaceae bacterium]